MMKVFFGLHKKEVGTSLSQIQQQHSTMAWNSLVLSKREKLLALCRSTAACTFCTLYILSLVVILSSKMKGATGIRATSSARYIAYHWPSTTTQSKKGDASRLRRKCVSIFKSHIIN
jgi:hypothetical protein